MVLSAASYISKPGKVLKNRYNFMMNIFKKLFGSPAVLAQTKTAKQEQARQDNIKRINDNTDKLWKFIEEALLFYNEKSCQCAFPRFRQIVSIDCVDTRSSFYASETEGFISIGKKYFTSIKLDSGPEAQNELWTCNKCGSVYAFGWADFSIEVNRTFLKIQELKTTDIGAEPTLPIPLFVGIFGHKFPGKDQLIPVDFETFKNYITALKT